LKSGPVQATGRVALQGNMDPCILFASEETLRQEVRKTIDAFGTQGHIFNLGHGMMPEHKPEAMAAMVEEVQAYSAKVAAAGK
jgi:uroporphyrinogen decarboxylase